MGVEAIEIMEKLDHIQSDLDFIKQRLADGDLILTADDVKALQEAEEDFKKRRTKRLI